MAVRFSISTLRIFYILPSKDPFSKMIIWMEKSVKRSTRPLCTSSRRFLRNQQRMNSARYW
jgi:hypothetical protein